MSIYLNGSATFDTSTGVYQLTTNSNDAGSIQTSQNASVQYVTQYKFNTPITSNIPYNYYLHIGDESSNIKYVINGSNFSITLNNTNTVFNLDNIKPYITYNTSNSLAANVSDNSIIVRLNDTNLVKITTSNMPKDFASASYIMVASSNPTTGNTIIFPHKVQEILFQATPSFENEVNFKQSIKVPTIYNDALIASNITTSNIVALTYSNLPILDSVSSLSTSNIATAKAVKQTYDTATFGSNAGAWSSNAHTSLSNAYYSSSTGAASTWASNAAAFGSNTASWSSNVSVFSSNASVWSSNSVYAVSNAFYTSSTGASSTFASNAAAYASNGVLFGSNAASYASNAATWASNNLLLSGGGNISGGLNVSGNVGIGTTTPAVKLDVRGSLYLEGSNGNWVGYSVPVKKEYIRFGTTDGPGGTDFARIYSEGSNNEGKLVVAIQDDLTSAEAFIVRGESYTGVSKDHLVVRNDGTIGIGKSNPTTTLDVNGTINATTYTGTTITNLTNASAHGSNTAVWSSNNLVKKSGDSMAFLNIVNDALDNPATSDPSYDSYSQLALTTANNVAGQSYKASLKMGVSSCNTGVGYIQHVHPWTGLGNLCLQPRGGAVGIGTITPVQMLDVRGNCYVRGAANKSAYIAVTDSNMVSEIRLTAHENKDAYIEFYSDLYIKRIGGATVTSLPILYIGSNGNFGIGTSNSKARFSMTGFSGTYNYGPHTEVYTYDDNRPVFQQLNYGHNNISLNFDSYWDGGNWRSTDSTNCFQIYKIYNKLAFNCAPSDAATVGNPVSWNTGICLTSDANVGIGTTNPTTKLYVAGDATITGVATISGAMNMAGGVTLPPAAFANPLTSTHFPYKPTVDSVSANYIRGNTIIADTGGLVSIGTDTTSGYGLTVAGGMSVSGGMRWGNQGKAIQYMTPFAFTVGTHNADIKVLTVDLAGGGLTMPNNQYHAIISYEQPSGNFDDLFVGKIHTKTTTSFVLSTARVDARGGWGSSVTAYIILWYYAI